MKKFRNFWAVLTSVVTLVSLGSATYISIFFPGAELNAHIIWQILTVSFLCSIWIVLYPERELSKKELMISCGGHYLLVNVIVLGCGLWFQWFEADNLPQVVGMLLVIAGVFVTVCMIMWKRESSEAKQMNERLQEYQEKNGDGD